MKIFHLFGRKETEEPLHQGVNKDPELAAKLQQESDAIHAMADKFLAEIEALKDDNGRLNIDDPKVRSRLANMVTELDAMQTKSHGHTPSVANCAVVAAAMTSIHAHPAFTRVNDALANHGLRADVVSIPQENTNSTDKTTSFALSVARDEHGDFEAPGTDEEISIYALSYWQDVDLRHPKEREQELETV